MSFIRKLFQNDEDEFEEVRVDREVLESVIYYAKQAYPNEFLAFFDGEIRNKILYVTGLIFVPGETCETGAVIHTERIPMNTKYLGSVHSHPGPSAQPSGADLKTFSKHGFFHMIVCLPYGFDTFRAYDRYGNPKSYTVGDYNYLVGEDNVGDFFDEDDVVTDDDVFKPGFFDEEDDEFFKTLDEERKNQYGEYENQSRPQIIKIELNPDGTIKNIIRESKK